jgi:hypothetical protein
MFVATADGAVRSYSIASMPPTPSPNPSVEPAVHMKDFRRVIFREATQPVPTPGSSEVVQFNKPLGMGVLNAVGKIVTNVYTTPSEASRGKGSGASSLPTQNNDHLPLGSNAEHYVVLIGTKKVEVVLTEPNGVKRTVSEKMTASLFSRKRSSAIRSTFYGSALSSSTPHASPVVSGKVVRVGGEPCVLLVTADGSVVGLDLPGLDPVGIKGLGNTPGVGVPSGVLNWSLTPSRVSTLEDGRVGVWSSEKELMVVAGLSDPDLYPMGERKMYDLLRQNAWHKLRGTPLSGGARDAELDAICKCNSNYSFHSRQADFSNLQCKDVERMKQNLCLHPVMADQSYQSVDQVKGLPCRWNKDLVHHRQVVLLNLECHKL